MAVKNTKTPAMVLQEFSVKYKLAPPTYEIISSVTGTHENRFDYRVSIAGIIAEGTGTSKQIGKHNAAQNALIILKEMGIYNLNTNAIPEFKVSVQNNVSPESPFKESPKCIGTLKDLCMEYKIPDPEFTLVSEVGPAHSRQFTFECNVASIKTVATGNTKKMAKQLAAKEMLNRIKDTLPDITEHYNRDKEQKAIEVNPDVLNRYNEFFGSIIPDKTVCVGDYSQTLKKLMTFNELTFNDFAQEFREQTESALKTVLDKLGLNYYLYEMQENPCIISLSISTDTPFTVMAAAETMETAKKDALCNCFQMMQAFMQ